LLPELVSSIAAVRMGAFDLAVGNLFGSNGLNMAIFLALDLAQPGPAIFAALDVNHAISALIAVILMGLGLAAIVCRAERRLAMIEPSSLLMLVAYMLGVWLRYTRATGG
jgi:cation:H+ antiporter